MRRVRYVDVFHEVAALPSLGEGHCRAEPSIFSPRVEPAKSVRTLSLAMLRLVRLLTSEILCTSFSFFNLASGGLAVLFSSVFEPLERRFGVCQL